MLRSKQFEIAIKGNVTMLIWLGKQYLGQTDKVEAADIGTKTIKLKYSVEKPKYKKKQ